MFLYRGFHAASRLGSSVLSARPVPSVLGKEGKSLVSAGLFKGFQSVEVFSIYFLYT